LALAEALWRLLLSRIGWHALGRIIAAARAIHEIDVTALFQGAIKDELSPRYLKREDREETSRC